MSILTNLSSGVEVLTPIALQIFLSERLCPGLLRVPDEYSDVPLHFGQTRSKAHFVAFDSCCGWIRLVNSR